MKELDNLREAMLKLTSLYGTPDNKQKRNLWNAYYELVEKLRKQDVKAPTDDKCIGCGKPFKEN